MPERQTWSHDIIQWYLHIVSSLVNHPCVGDLSDSTSYRATVSIYIVFIKTLPLSLAGGSGSIGHLDIGELVLADGF